MGITEKTRHARLLLSSIGFPPGSTMSLQFPALVTGHSEESRYSAVIETESGSL
ncbi:predicted protein [Pyrenophora tritici-repentis Pt-1C-BFP]|uniref:Uncharacterized protein n=1 Tax=Pyrenophora tritici-repentis (strain Pt-1C-BFP) TaxID=426418 RepID=B2WC99_PYRTR|nr:uncharacterized protein PTRG_07608 [Pyrenophora tritici-repentis Pt-1C-BFP]EDU50527.1 predicted protein [Pyrenophora tritici-repentis Pt-1C-BFP]